MNNKNQIVYLLDTAHTKLIHRKIGWCLQDMQCTQKHPIHLQKCQVRIECRLARIPTMQSFQARRQCIVRKHRWNRCPLHTLHIGSILFGLQWCLRGTVYKKAACSVGLCMFQGGIVCTACPRFCHIPLTRTFLPRRGCSLHTVCLPRSRMVPKCTVQSLCTTWSTFSLIRGFAWVCMESRRNNADPVHR